MKKILTGGCGFIGSHLAEKLVSKNYKVTVFDRYNIDNDFGNLENSKLKKNIEIKRRYKRLRLSLRRDIWS